MTVVRSASVPQHKIADADTDKDATAAPDGGQPGRPLVRNLSGRSRIGLASGSGSPSHSLGRPFSGRNLRKVASKEALPQPLTTEVLLASTNMPRFRGEDNTRFLGRMTHLQLQGKRLGPGLDRLDLVPAAYVVYAYDNLLSHLNGLDSLRRLQLLYVQNNRLVDMSGIEGLAQLRKLHVGYNRLTRIEGLENCKLLEELFVPGQQTLTNAPLEFASTSIDAIAGSLRVLDAANNRLEDVSALAPLYGLNNLNLSNNSIEHISDMRDLLQSENLKTVQLAGNPLAAHERGYRSSVVLLAKSIEEIDGRAVLPQERDFIGDFRSRRTSWKCSGKSTCAGSREMFQLLSQLRKMAQGTVLEQPLLFFMTL